MTLRSLSTLLLGVALVLHGLANTVLPLRGTDAGASGMLLPGVTALYIVAIVGFVAAGLGVLGTTPLGRVIVPASLVAGIASLAGQFWRADTDLWPGVLLSATLPILATLHVSDGTPVNSPTRHPWLRRTGTAIGWALLVWMTLSAALWPWHRSWGATATEWEMPLPGDRVPRTPALEILHAVTIDAPPDRVWPWLVQIGQDRGGFYSYTWLERAFGAEISNADTIHPEWQSLKVGDTVYATQSNYLGGIFGVRPGWTVDRIEPGSALVLRNWGSFVLRPAAGGRTRFLIRSTISNERIPAWLAAINFTGFELPHFIMQRRMLLGIKARAEAPAT